MASITPPPPPQPSPFFFIFCGSWAYQNGAAAASQEQKQPQQPQQQLQPQQKDAAKKSPKSEADYDREWTARFGPAGARIVRATVDANMDDYRFLRQFAMNI